VPRGDDPTDIRSLAVSAEDLISALEARRRTDREAVLRVTPPFGGRMRARLHVAQDDTDDAPTSDATDPAPLHADPDALVSDPPPYPEPADTEDEIRADPDLEYSRELHHERHLDAVEAGRERVREAVREEATIETEAGPHRVGVTLLG